MNWYKKPISESSLKNENYIFLSETILNFKLRRIFFASFLKLFETKKVNYKILILIDSEEREILQKTKMGQLYVFCILEYKLGLIEETGMPVLTCKNIFFFFILALQKP